MILLYFWILRDEGPRADWREVARNTRQWVGPTRKQTCHLRTLPLFPKVLLCGKRVKNVSECWRVRVYGRRTLEYSKAFESNVSLVSSKVKGGEFWERNNHCPVFLFHPALTSTDSGDCVQRATCTNLTTWRNFIPT